MASAKIDGTHPRALPDASTSAVSTVPDTQSIIHPSLMVEPTTQSPLNQLNPSELQEHLDKIQPISPSANHIIPRDSFAPQSIPGDFQADPSHRIPPHHRQHQNRRYDKGWKQILGYAKRVFNKLWRRSKRGKGTDGHDDTYTFTIELVFENPPGNEIHRYGKATLDTGNPFNIVSPAFAAKFGLEFDAAKARVILSALGGGHCASMGTIPGRWHWIPSDPRDTRVRINPKFLDAEFEISSTDDPFDVIIGRKTILKEQLLELGPGAGFTGFRTNLNTPKEAEIEKAERKQNKLMEENLALKKALQRESSTSKNTKTQSSNATN